MTAEVTLIQPDTAWKIGDGAEVGCRGSGKIRQTKSSLNRMQHIRFTNQTHRRESAGLSAGVGWPSGQLT